MSKFRDYLASNERKYHYRIKTVQPLDDSAMDKIERAIVKYLPLDIGRVEKTIFQRNPLDFPGVENAEIYYVDITTGLPASSYVLQQDIRFALNIPEKFIVVRAPNEPTEVETQRINAEADMAAEADSKGLKVDALLNTSLDYPEARDVDATDYYGDKYNIRFLQALKEIEDARDMEIKAANAPKPFDWLESDMSPKQDMSDFNALIKDAPAPAHKGVKAAPSETTDSGNLDDNERVYKKAYTANGKTTILTQTGVAVKKKGK
jgi:hypothetical protein